MTFDLKNLTILNVNMLIAGIQLFLSDGSDDDGDYDDYLDYVQPQKNT